VEEQSSRLNLRQSPTPLQFTLFIAVLMNPMDPIVSVEESCADTNMSITAESCCFTWTVLEILVAAWYKSNISNVQLRA
jgi:hypothetical protein